MGFGDDEPPALRVDPFPATLSSANHFNILILTFVSWDVIKLDSSVNGGPVSRIQFNSGRLSTDFVFTPAISGATYRFWATGCARAIDGSTNHCSPASDPIDVLSATNTNSLTQFLQRSGVDLQSGVQLRGVLGVSGSEVSIRHVMGLDV
jgi:hypothetical protein